MHYFYEKLSQSTKMGTYTDTDPYIATYAITPNEISFTGFYIDVASVSAGINAGNPCTTLIEFSRDGGTKWNGVAGASISQIDAAGQFMAEAGGQTFVGPLMRITVTPPAGESIVITEVGVRRIRPGMVATLLSYGAGGGGLGDVGIFYQRGPGGVYANTKPTYDTSTPANNRPLPVWLTPDSGNPVTEASTVGGVLTMSDPAYGQVTFNVLTAWTGAARQEAAWEAVAVGARHSLTLATTAALPTASVLFGWDDTAGDHTEARVSVWGALNSGLMWTRDGAEQEVVEDTGTPANNRALPVQAMGWNDSAGAQKPVTLTPFDYLQVQETAQVGGTIYNDYGSVNVTTGAWVQLDPGIGAAMTGIEIFDGSGQVMELGIGAGGAEVRKILIMPGGNGKIPIDIPIGTRVSIRAVSADATSGFLAINWFMG